MTTFGLDPDPLDLSHHPAYVLGYEHGWTDAPRHPGGKLVVAPCADPACRFVAYDVFPPRPNRRLRALLVSVAMATGVLVGIFIGRAVAASRPAPVIPAVHEGIVGREPDQERTGTPTGEDAAGVPLSRGRSGAIAFADPSLGSRYLAIPIGPGRHVRVCGPAACWTTVSTDAGPNRERLVAGRIADVALEHWRTICGLPKSAGVCKGSWELVGPGATPPATDTHR